MAKSFKNLFDKMTPEAQVRAKAKTQAMLKEMPLYELRRAREFTQKQLAEIMKINQASVSKMEHGADMYISTLKNYIRSMGGSLEIVANFPDGAVRISKFGDLEMDKTD